jgi:carbonic anhydrase
MRNLIALFACSCIALSAKRERARHLRAAKLAASVSKPASASLPAARRQEADRSAEESPSRRRPMRQPRGRPQRPRRPRRRRAKAKKRPKSTCRPRSPSAWPSCASASRRARVPPRAKKPIPGAGRRAAPRRQPPPLPGRRAQARHHWSYEGELGPANWSKINPAGPSAAPATASRRSTCATASRSTWNRSASTTTRPRSTRSNNGHTIQVTVGGGNFITVGNQTYELQQFHFHRPSEERINGKGTRW